MGLFDEPLAAVNRYLAEARRKGLLRESRYEQAAAWPRQHALVLREDTAVELGGVHGSLLLLLWEYGGGPVGPGRISLAGPEPEAGAAATFPLGLVITVRGGFTDDYAAYTGLRDAVFGTRPRGVSMRFRPDGRQVWARIGREALAGGFSLARYGNTLIEQIGALPGAAEAEVLFVTAGAQELAALAPAAERAGEITEALLKMHHEAHFDCDACRYQPVCDQVAELKAIRDRLARGGKKR